METSAWKNHFNFVWPLTFDEQDICHFRFFSKAITQIKILWKFEIGDLVFSWKKLMNSSPVPVSDANCLRMLSRWERTSKVSSENAQYIINFDYLLTYIGHSLDQGQSEYWTVLLPWPYWFYSIIWIVRCNLSVVISSSTPKPYIRAVARSENQGGLVVLCWA